MTATRSLQEVAVDLGLVGEMKDPVRWLTRQIKAGRITARRIGRSWRMTAEDVESALEAFASKPEPSQPAADAGVRCGTPTAASMRRRVPA